MWRLFERRFVLVSLKILFIKGEFYDSNDAEWPCTNIEDFQWIFASGMFFAIQMMELQGFQEELDTEADYQVPVPTYAEVKQIWGSNLHISRLKHHFASICYQLSLNIWWAMNQILPILCTRLKVELAPTHTKQFHRCFPTIQCQLVRCPWSNDSPWRNWWEWMAKIMNTEAINSTLGIVTFR